MKFTATEIREKSFEKNFRGYDKDEVTEFLKTLSEAWDKLENEKIDLERRLQFVEQEAKKLKDVEISLFRTLKTAEDTGASIIEEANRTAHELLTDAHQSSDKMVRDAQMQAQRILEEAEKKSAETLNELKNRIKGSIRDFDALVNNRTLILKNLKRISADLEETLTKSDKDFENSSIQSFSDILDQLNEFRPSRMFAAQVVHENTDTFQEEQTLAEAEPIENVEKVVELDETPVPDEKSEVTASESKHSQEEVIEKSETIQEVEASASKSEESPKETVQEATESTQSEQRKDKKEGSFFDQLD